MSAQFSKGDRVRVIDVEGYNSMLPVTLKYGAEHTVEEAREHIIRVDDGSRQYWKASRFEKVEPEFVVGQQVSGDDYARLPVGSRATWTYRAGSKPVPSVKVGDDAWREGEGVDAAIRANHEMHLPRTLTRLGDGTHAELEDKDDLYVEPERTRVLHIRGEGSGDVGAACGHELATGSGANPKHVGHSRSSFIGWIAGGGRDLSPETDACADCVSLAQQPVTEPSVDNSEDLTEPEDADDVEPEPLKEGDACLIWATVRGVADDRAVHVDITTRHAHALGLVPHADAIVRPDEGQTPPWVKRAQCTSLLMIDKTTNLRQCTRDGDGHDNHVAYGASWKDDEAYGRVVVSDGAS